MIGAFLTVLVFGGTGLFLGSVARVTLVAEGSIEIHDTLKNDDGPVQVIGKLNSGDEVSVIARI